VEPWNFAQRGCYKIFLDLFWPSMALIKPAGFLWAESVKQQPRVFNLLNFILLWFSVYEIIITAVETPFVVYLQGNMLVGDYKG